jgi:hypothetical protein
VQRFPQKAYIIIKLKTKQLGAEECGVLRFVVGDVPSELQHQQRQKGKTSHEPLQITKADRIEKARK